MSPGSEKGDRSDNERIRLDHFVVLDPQDGEASGTRLTSLCGLPAALKTPAK